MTTHVFVVDTITFKLHLKYMFAGTGAKEKESPFLENPLAVYNASTERNLTGMIADISRIRPGDNIIFYLQASPDNQGMFFGIFKAESIGFFDENDEDNYLKSELGKGLSFRVRIAPYKVYPKGITEHEYLDNLENKSRPYQLCWSMIYRKLKGNRGCTMLLDYEYEDLLLKLQKKNQNQILEETNFSYNEHQGIIEKSARNCSYLGRMMSLNIEKRLLFKANRKNAFETHLQALVLQKIDTEEMKNLILTLDNGTAWIGNEVSCGVGMQRIDILVIEEDDENIHIRIVELKDEKPYDSILDEQLPWYLMWVSQYVVPNLCEKGKKVWIHPCILAEETKDERMICRMKEEMISCHIESSAEICATEYISFRISGKGITFKRSI